MTHFTLHGFNPLHLMSIEGLKSIALKLKFELYHLSKKNEGNIFTDFFLYFQFIGLFKNYHMNHKILCWLQTTI